MGGRLGYSAATGIAVIVAVLVRHHCAGVDADPDRRDLADPALHRHADRRAGLPGIAEEPRARRHPRAHAASRRMGQTADRQFARRCGTSAAAIGIDKLAQVGVLYQGLAVMGGGAIVGGLVLGAIAVYVIDRRIPEGGGIRAGGRGAHVLRLHARRGDRHRADAVGRGLVSDRRRHPARVRQNRPRHSPDRSTRRRNRYTARRTNAYDQPLLRNPAATPLMVR